MEVKIEQQIPLPAPRQDMSNYRNALDMMQPNDSFEAPADVRKHVRALVGQHKRKNPGQSFRTRTLPDGSLRVWKVL